MSRGGMEDRHDAGHLCARVRRKSARQGGKNEDFAVPFHMNVAERENLCYTCICKSISTGLSGFWRKYGRETLKTAIRREKPGAVFPPLAAGEAATRRKSDRRRSTFSSSRTRTPLFSANVNGQTKRSS